MSESITFTPDVVSLAIADQLATEQGVTLDQIATEAFAAYMQGVREAMAVDLDEDARGS
jgi:hypothetical protein